MIVTCGCNLEYNELLENMSGQPCVCVLLNDLNPLFSFPCKGAVACGLLHSVLLLLPALLPVLQQQLTGGVLGRRDGGAWHVRHSELETVDLTLAVLIGILTVDYSSACMQCDHTCYSSIYVPWGYKFNRY